MARRPLSGAFEKVRRANHYIRALNAELDGLKDSKPYDLVPNHDIQCVDWIEIPRSEAQKLGVRVYFPIEPPSDPNYIRVPLIHAETDQSEVPMSRTSPICT